MFEGQFLPISILNQKWLLNQYCGSGRGSGAKPRSGNFITISRTETGDYKPDRHPIWVDSDHVPVMGFSERFPSIDEALEWIRQAVDEETRLGDDYQRGLRELREALESVPC